MQRLSARVVVVVVCLSLLALGVPARSRYEWYDYQTIWENGSVASITYHYTDADWSTPDWAYAEIFTDELDIQILWTPYTGLRLLYAFFYDGEIIYPDFPGEPDTVASLGLAPLPGDPPCTGEDCNACINMQLAICQQKAKADLAVATTAYLGALALCGAAIVTGPPGPAVTLLCATIASTAYGAAAYKIKTDKRICQHDRPRAYCKHEENGEPCLP
jgi:hypothetical protein